MTKSKKDIFYGVLIDGVQPGVAQKISSSESSSSFNMLLARLILDTGILQILTSAGDNAPEVIEALARQVNAKLRVEIVDSIQLN